MRYENFLQNELYHVSANGSGNLKLFLDQEDCLRFIFLITHFQSPIQIYNVRWHIERYLKKGSYDSTPNRPNLILKERNIELFLFALLPDEAHVIIKNREEGILSVYMQRILTAYGKYFNKKYGKRGHVFNGPFQAAHIKNTEELLKISGFLHKLEGNLESSYRDFVGENRWGELLSTETILKHFKNQAEYKKFVESKIEPPKNP
jgi:hypothetical protein